MGNCRVQQKNKDINLHTNIVRTYRNFQQMKTKLAKKKS